MNTKESIIQGLHSVTRPLFSAAILGFLSSAAPGQTTTTYGTGAGETSTPYAGGTINAGDTVRLNDGAGNVTGNIVDNGTLDFNRSTGTLTISGTVSGNGTLNLSNSGTLQLSGTAPITRFIPLNMTINANSGSLITPIVTGTQNGILQLGQSGTGTLNVAGGYVTSNNLTAGQGGGVGTINVSSGTLRPTAFLTLGGTGGGSGTLNVTGGLVGGPVGQGLGSGIQIARTETSSGLMTITSGSVVVNGNSTVIGELGTGTASVNSGGFFQAGRVDIGSGSTGVGTLNINASGKADFLSYLTVGGTGQGTFTVNGGLIQTRGGTIGGSAGSLGTATITSGTWLNNATGNGSEIAGYLTVGGSGTGSLTINNGGYVVVTGTFTKGANGTLTLNQGGTLQIGGVNGNSNGGIARYMVASTGTVGSGTAGVLVGDLNYAGTLKFAQNSAGASPTLTYNGNLSGSGDLVKTGTGTLLIGGSNSYTGGTTITAGVVALNSADAIGTTGTISFGGGTLRATANNTTDYSSRFSNADNQKYSVDSNGETLTLASNLTSSGGSFAKVGSGTVTLTGANTFASGTVGAGLLQGSAQSLATSGTFGTGGLTELRFNQTTNDSWSGKLFGTGTASKYGAGTLTLSGSGGGTTGTLLISEGAVRGTTDSVKRNIVNNSQLTFDQSTTGTYASLISGSGNMLLNNSGTITFTGNNTMTGTATVDGGRLIASKASAMPSQVVNNAAVSFNNATNGTYAGVISGSGLLAKSGAGDMTLTGANSYSGGTEISAGTLIGDTTSLQGNVAVSGGNLKFNQATNGTFSAALSGAGNIFKLGAGDLTLAGTNTNAGPWIVSAGRVIGTTSSLRGSITNSAAVTFDQSTSGTYSSNMSGTGSLTKSGSGGVVMSGSNTYTGTTTVSEGSLVVNGSLANTALTVQTGALLGGSGSIGSASGALVAIQSGGSLAPGNSPGMLTVNGGLTLSLGSSYHYEVVSGSAMADSVDVNGALTVDQTTLSMTNLGTYVGNQKFTLFAYESLIGTFDGLADDTTFTAGGGEWLINYNDTTGGLNTEAVGASYITLTAVPEPSTLLIGALGCVGLLRRRR